MDIAAGKICSLSSAAESMRMEMHVPTPTVAAATTAINTEQRAGRGTVSPARQEQIEERARWLTEDIDEADFEHAVLDEDLSDVTVHTFQDE